MPKMHQQDIWPKKEAIVVIPRVQPTASRFCVTCHSRCLGGRPTPGDVAPVWQNGEQCGHADGKAPGPNGKHRRRSFWFRGVWYACLASSSSPFRWSSLDCSFVPTECHIGKKKNIELFFCFSSFYGWVKKCDCSV